MADSSPEKKSGCVSMLYSGLFRRRDFWPKRTSSTNTIPSPKNNANANVKIPSPNTKRRRGGSDEASFLDSPHLSPPKLVERPISNRPIVNPHMTPHNNQDLGRKPTVGAKLASSQGLGQGRRAPMERIGISGELESMITDYQQSKGSSNLVRASSSNVMLMGSLGNLRQSGGTQISNVKTSSNDNILDYLPKTAREMESSTNEKYEVREPQKSKEPTGSLCRAISTRMDPEQLKVMGNEDYKEGRFAEALALYEHAILIDPSKASYRSNKSAALTALGRLLEAVFECREAIKIDPYYHRAHHRLANLNLRLGEAEKALYHYKHSGPEADTTDIAKAKILQTHLLKCTEARRHRDWNTLIKETGLTISCGADSAPQIFTLQAEAFLKLHRHQDADTTLLNGPNFNFDDCTKFFGPVGNANLLLIRAQVDMAAGRFDDAVVAAQRASRLDSSNKEINAILRRTRGAAAARSNGNELFKTSKFLEACTAYGDGLKHDPLNSVLLCNRAACQSKLGQFERALEDCTKALNVRPSYTKARLRKADCNLKLERWEASLQDYELLVKEMPEDEEVARALSEVKSQVKKHRREVLKDSNFLKDSNLSATDDVAVTSNEDFRHFIKSPGLSVVLFCNKSSDEEALQLMAQLSKRYASVNFLELEVDDHPHLAKSEGVTSVPGFKIYKNGSRIKDISGTNFQLLESSVKFYNT
ncbi:hypothetical protein GIB67_038885 [Kingdonia uniflora]|uniref:Thioredoxin domain-containing protein n=1 Tax=Kingdonia uniflora TaxID=39325 RepID=A0A7J7M2M9_9MAGN|nr:hypothetical protein GIB67_038885 [Kingdonia uniflora]